MIRGSKMSEKCKLSMVKNEKQRAHVNIFEVKNHRGWWPFVMKDDANNNQIKLSGKVEAEFILLTEEQALAKPAGLGREPPDPMPEPK
jgi:hypothetical protein